MPQSLSSPPRDPPITEPQAMTVEEALQVIWIGPRQPLGELLASREIGRWNLQQVIAKGYGPPRQAAETLLAVWDDLPGMPAMTRRYGPRVIRGSYYLEDKADESLMLLGAVLGLTLMAGIFVLKALVEQLLDPTTSPLQAGLSVLTFLVFMGGVVFWGWRTFWQALNWIRGKAGEEQVLEVLRTLLDQQWTIFRNLHVPGRNDDLDLVLIGPAGVWVVEVKAYRGAVRVTGDRWERRVGGGWRLLGSKENPAGQVKGNAARLRNFLNEQAIAVPWVMPVIALSKPQRPQDVAAADPPIWLLPVLEQEGLTLTGRQPLLDAQRHRVVEVLRIEAERQIAREQKK